MDYSGDGSTADAAVKLDSASEFEVLPSLIVAEDEIDSSDLAEESLNENGNTTHDIEPGTTSDIEPDTRPDIKPDSSTNTEPNKDSNAESNTYFKTSPATSINAAPETISNAEPDTSPNTEQLNTNSEPDASTNAEPDTNAKPDTSVNGEPETIPDAEPDTSVNAELNTSPSAKLDTSSNAELDSSPNANPGTSSNKPDTSPNHQADQNADALLQKTAFDIVEDTIVTSSLSLQSSGDFSMLHDAEQFKAATEEQNDSEEKGETVEKLTDENTKSEPEVEKDQDTTENTEEKEENDWMDVFGNGLLKKKILTPGQGQESRPKKEEEVSVTIETLLMDDSVYEEKKEYQFVIGDIEMPYAIDFSVNLMELKEKCKVVSDKKYCLRQDGGPTTELPHDQLVYIIELLDIQKGPYSSQTQIQKRLDWVEKKRNLGNYIYSNNEFELANVAYKKCLQVLNKAGQEQHSNDAQDDIQLLSLKCHNNQSATLMKLGRWKDAKEACAQAEAIDPINIKTLFRKGKILAELGQSKESIAALKKANMINPEDKTVLNELNKQNKRLEQQNKKHMGMCKRMLGDFAKKSDEKEVVKREQSKGFWSKNSVMVGGSLVAVGAAVLLGFYLMHK